MVRTGQSDSVSKKLYYLGAKLCTMIYWCKYPEVMVISCKPYYQARFFGLRKIWQW